MNKKQLIDRVTEKVDMKKSDVRNVVEVILEELMNAIVVEKEANLVGFGEFQIREKASRLGTDPVSHKAIILPKTYHVGFKMGAFLRKKLKTLYKVTEKNG